MPTVFAGARHATMEGRKCSRDRERYMARVKAAKINNPWHCGEQPPKDFPKFKNSAIAVDNDSGPPVMIMFDGGTFDHTWGPELMQAENTSKYRVD